MKPVSSNPVVVVSQPGRQTLHLVVTGQIVVGRECEGLLITDEEVSRRHLELAVDGGRVLCTDLQSSNGTFLDGERISVPIVIDANAVVTLGNTTIRLAELPTAPHMVRRKTTVASNALRETSIDRVVDMVTADAWKPPDDSGTMTILFSDIESSTERVSRIGDAAWFDLLEIHNTVFREELAKAGGREIKGQGDGFMLTFASVRRALAFAIAVQERFSSHAVASPEHAVRVRMGLHTGEVITDETGDLFGRHVNKAARVANLALGNQILVSGTVREIASGDLSIEFGQPIEVELKGLDGVHTIYEVLWQS